MKHTILLLLLFVGVFSLESNAQEAIDSIQWKIANDLFQEANSIYNANPDSALILLTESVEHYKQSKSWGDYIMILNAMSTVHYYRNEFDLYYSYSNQAIKEAELKLPSNHPEYAGALNNINSYHYKMGNYDKSIEFLRKSLEIRKENNANPLQLAFLYNNIGTVLGEKGDYSQSLEYLFKALDLRRDTFQEAPTDELQYLLVASKVNIAFSYLNSEQWKLALEYYETSLEELKKIKKYNQNVVDRDIITALQNIANIHHLRGDEVAAKKTINEAIRYQKKEDSFKKSYSFELLGEIYQKQGLFDKAIIQYEKALRLAEKYYSKTELPNYARKFNRLAGVKEELGELDEALTYYQKALKVLAPNFNPTTSNLNPTPSELFSKPDALEILVGKGRTLWAQYEQQDKEALLVESFKTYESGVHLIAAIREEIVTEAAKNNLSENTIPIYEGAIRTALERYKQSNDRQWLDQALALAESNKSLLLLEAFNEQAALGIKGLPDSLLQRDHALRLEIAFYQKKLLEENKDSLIAEGWNNQLFNLKRDLEGLSNFFEKNYPKFYAQKYQQGDLNVKEGQLLLADKQQGLIEYFVGEENIYGFVIWGQGYEVFEIPYEDQLFEAIETLRGSIDQAPEDADVLKNYQDFCTASYHLYSTLLQPAIDYLPASIRSLKIIPDDRLNYIPFDLLLEEKVPANEAYFSTNHLEYVLERYRISYDYSLIWMLKNQNNKQNYEENFIAYAPSFKSAGEAIVSRSCQANELYQLECGEVEVKAINDLLHGELRLNESAAKSIFEQEAARYRIIHMATHACADEVNPLFNKIFLDDDYLSNADLYNTSLNAELVVLSACNTGSGKLVKGEGVLSLARGFVQSGCASSVVSRWSVDDCATAQIMTYFYEGLQDGKEKHEALRQAKLRFLSEADQLHSHPYYWSAFVAYGEMDAMDLNSQKNWWWLFLLIILGGVWGFLRFRKGS